MLPRFITVAAVSYRKPPDRIHRHVQPLGHAVDAIVDHVVKLATQNVSAPGCRLFDSRLDNVALAPIVTRLRTALPDRRTMRLQIEVTTTATSLPWHEVLSPGRAVAYHLLNRTAPGLARQLHNYGWGQHALKPIGHSAPVFPAASRQRGHYAVGGRGIVEFGSPLVEVVEAWAAALRDTPVIFWGGTALRVLSINAAHPPLFATGRARMRTTTPVVTKGSGRDGTGARVTRQAWLLPGHPEFGEYFEKNLRRKAETLGLPPDVRLKAVTWVGSQRTFRVGSDHKTGAPVEVELSGEPGVLQAAWSWGLGQSNVTGFGWVAGG